METEKWKPIREDKTHEISSFGRVRSLDYLYSYLRKDKKVIKRLRKGKILTPRVRSGGYLAVMLSYKGKDLPIHHLVAESFIGVRPKGYMINHINSIKTDNKYSNLEWVTSKENRQHSIRTGLARSNKGQNWNHVSRDNVRKIRKEYGKILTSIIARKFGVSRSTVSRIGLNRTFKNI